MKMDLEMLEAMVANGANGAAVLAMVRVQCNRYEALRAARRPIEAESKRRIRGGHKRTSMEASGSEVDTSGHRVDIGRTSVDTTKFDEFWKAYPKRLGSNPRSQAEKLFNAAVKAGAEPAAIIAGARAFALVEAKKIGTEFIPQTVKWLRNKCWQDYSATINAEDTEIPGFYAAADSEQLAAWDAYGIRTTGKGMPRDRNQGWRVKAEWPPGYSAARSPDQSSHEAAE